jgi:Secretion system C-terminal sorting domain
MKFSTLPYAPTGNLYISGTTRDSKANDGGYFIAMLNSNFLNSVPTSMVWTKRVWAEGETFTNQPWDIGSDGKVVYIQGQSHAADWCQVSRLTTSGTDDIVPVWRTHWDNLGMEYKGLPGNYTGPNTLVRSGIVLKRPGRCDLRSWTTADFNLITPDGNGGTKKGKWPMDFLYNSPCNILSVSTTGPGYNGYKSSSTQTYAGLAVVIDKRDNSFFIGMNTKSVINSTSLPDFEPAVFKMNNQGELQWWSRLYHEIKPNGDTVLSEPDQYIDGLAIDYANDQLLVNARCHGNNTTNFWRGENIPASPGIVGFQKQWTGTNGNIHISWLGKLQLNNGTFKAATFVAEYVDNVASLGAAHPDPNMDGWPNPNGGWPNVNTTRISRNSISVATDGSVYLAGVGRRSFTTANAHQKMLKPNLITPNFSSWNAFVRAYSPNLDSMRYSSIITGVWDSTTGAGGDNTAIFAVHKTTNGLVAVGVKSASGNEIPVSNVPSWGTATSQDSSAVFAFYQDPKLNNIKDLLFFGAAPLAIGVELNGLSLSDKNELVWRVSIADDIEFFDLEKSNDGIHFEPFVKINADASQLQYSIEDEQLTLNKNYYRVKVMSKNQKYYYSNTVHLYNELNNAISVAPNPAKTNIAIKSQIELKDATYNVIDLSGLVIVSAPFSGQAIDLSSLKAGAYYFSLHHKDGVWTTLLNKE